MLFDSGVRTAIPLRYDEDKCTFMDLLAAVPTNTGGGTNAHDGGLWLGLFESE